MAFAMTFGLMLSDYLSRQVINAVFPFLKADWGLSDTQLGALVSVVALTIGLTSIPISLVADRVGRVKSATVMALVWGSATVACGLAGNFTSLLVARALVGLGEAGYGSAGAAILTHAFPQRLHSTVMGSFLAAGMIGSVLGVVIGGYVAQAMGWQAAFMLMGAFGLVFACLFPIVVKEPPSPHAEGVPRPRIREVFATLLTTPTLMLVALAGGFTMFVQGTFLAWLPSYLNRYYGLDPAKASAGTGLLIVCAGVGMIVGGALVDRLSRHDRDRRLRICVIYCAILAGSLLLAFSFEPGIVQFLLIGLGLSMSSSFLGPALAVAADVTPESSHATTFAVLALAYMLIGAAPGPLVTGWIADVTSLKTALFLAPIGGVAGACFFFLASRTYRRDRQQLHGR
jgi:MFS family permease